MALCRIGNSHNIWVFFIIIMFFYGDLWSLIMIHYKAQMMINIF